ncbi:MBL fold metallo-hydrolase [Aquibium sp. A9E412]|uniref:MBL fold metallo-hydrolase n=1 Tax=Aquibium sp. A9E412 TaxID=2976767 RepID=UPI0025B0EF25|nr:MBL fold metallo-hydrolase [Aquibium sp. A9E412]MDN2565685.1 MBL fold metallo-hydrolase [Aquibium sp. A9E412]
MNRRKLLTTVGLGGLGALAVSGLTVGRGRANAYYDGPPSDHFDGRVFFNPDGTPPRHFADLLRWQLGGGKAAWPAAWPSPHPPARPVPRVDGTGLRVTMVGHATLLVQTAGLNILTDPVWSQRASPVGFAGPRRVNPPGIAFDDLPPVDLVLLTHNHYDHMDVATLARLRAAHDPLVVTPLGNDAILADAVPGLKVRAHDWGDSLAVGPATVHVEPVHHWSARGMTDRRMALWAGFVVDGPAGKVYCVGDTGFHDGINYRAAAARHGGFRLALLPVGAYAPRWFMQGQHQDPDEAVAGFALCGAAFAAGHHWGTFQLTNEPIEEPRQRLDAALRAAGVAPPRFRAMRPGEVWDVPQPAV